MDDEITVTVGPKHARLADRPAVRHASTTGSGVLGGHRVAVRRPRARTTDGREVQLASYAAFAADDQLDRVVFERMLAGRHRERHGGAVAAGRTGRPRVGRQRAAGGDRWRQGVGGGGASGVRRPCARAALHHPLRRPPDYADLVLWIVADGGMPGARDPMPRVPAGNSPGVDLDPGSDTSAAPVRGDRCAAGRRAPASPAGSAARTSRGGTAAPRRTRSPR